MTKPELSGSATLATQRPAPSERRTSRRIRLRLETAVPVLVRGDVGLQWGLARNVSEGGMLIEQGVTQPRLARHASRGGLEIAGDDLEDGRLAGAVASDDPPPLALGDGEGDVLEQLRRAEGDTDVG